MARLSIDEGGRERKLSNLTIITRNGALTIN